ncbi:hypothetical protein SEVIR_1G174266v4 [Setaria viridis]
MGHNLFFALGFGDNVVGRVGPCLGEGAVGAPRDGEPGMSGGRTSASRTNAAAGPRFSIGEGIADRPRAAAAPRREVRRTGLARRRLHHHASSARPVEADPSAEEIQTAWRSLAASR